MYHNSIYNCNDQYPLKSKDEKAEGQKDGLLRAFTGGCLPRPNTAHSTHTPVCKASLNKPGSMQVYGETSHSSLKRTRVYNGKESENKKHVYLYTYYTYIYNWIYV